MGNSSGSVRRPGAGSPSSTKNDSKPPGVTYVNVRDASAYVSVGELVTILATAEQTAGAFALMESVFARGAEPPPHVHHRGDESFFVLEGDLTVRVGDDTLSAAPGSFVFCPRDVPHLLTLHSEQARTLT